MSVDDHILHTESGILHADSPRAKVDQMVASALSNRASGPLVVHFHGGLVDYDAGRAIATRLEPHYEHAGAFPVFFLWEAGLFETVLNNLGDVAKEAIFKLTWQRVQRIVQRKLIQVIGGRDAGDLPPLPDTRFDDEIAAALQARDVTPLMNQPTQHLERLQPLSPEEERMLEAELSYDFELLTEAQNISDALRDPVDIHDELTARSYTVRGSTHTLMDPDALEQFVERPQPNSRGLVSTTKLIRAVVKIAGKVIGRMIRGRDHGLHATIVEEILRALYLANVGGLVWRTMKQDTADSFGSDTRTHGGSAFIDALLQQVDPTDPLRIVLVGHSTGSVYISHFLDRAAEVLPPSITFDLVYLAPAATCRLTARTFEQHSARIANFRMFSMSDENERDDQLVKYLYPHSLLYFVSGVVESEIDMPLVGMDRFFDSQAFPADRFPEVATVRAYVDAGADRFVRSVATGNPAGNNTTALKHGDFDNDTQTVESLAHIIAHGYT